MRKPVVLITGAGGEIGHGLIVRLTETGRQSVVTLDINPLDATLAPLVAREFTGSILDTALLERILSQYEVDTVFHLAALLSTRSEFTPITAHQVNVEGTLHLLEFSQHEAESHGRPVVFVYPSSIAAYGLPDLATKARAGRVAEDDYTTPSTMYGCNKLYCEQLGRYYARHYKQLSADPQAGRVDFRCVRFPGLISALTVPSGGTSDYAPEMIHAAAKGEPYACFVRPDTQIPFMAMPDGVTALLTLAAAPRAALSRTAYNLGAFNPTAQQIHDRVRQAFPDARLGWTTDVKRQGIVDSWPADVDDSAARRDWGFAPVYDFERAFAEYLIPMIGARYAPGAGVTPARVLGGFALAALAVSGGCLRAPIPTAATDNAAAESYVRLVLALGQHDDAFVDAYYGPPEWRTAAAQEKLPLFEINKRAAVLEVDLRRLPAIAPGLPDGELLTLRRHYLARQLNALRARLAMLQGGRFTFDEESRELYDAVAPRNDEASFEAVIADVGARIGGEGELAPRYAAYRQAFVIPPGKLDAVFQAAIAECRRRTQTHVSLPPGERFTVSYVKDKPWSAYNWYQGDFASLIEVNTDLPVYIDRAIDLACHEGYPGHHVYNALLEQHLVKQRGWVEFSVYPLFSPQSLIAEGTANYGIQVAFTEAERRRFERETLFPLAGLDPSRVDEYYDLLALTRRLSYAGNEAARGYLDGRMDATRAADWLVRFAMNTPGQAAQRVEFFDAYRSYVINYNLGEDLVKAYVERHAGADPVARWKVFAELLSSPRLPSGLQE